MLNPCDIWTGLDRFLADHAQRLWFRYVGRGDGVQGRGGGAAQRRYLQTAGESHSKSFFKAGPWLHVEPLRCATGRMDLRTLSTAYPDAPPYEPLQPLTPSPLTSYIPILGEQQLAFRSETCSLLRLSIG